MHKIWQETKLLEAVVTNKKYLEFNSWEWGYKNSRNTLEYLKKDHDQSKALLTELGMAKQ